MKKIEKIEMICAHISQGHYQRLIEELTEILESEILKVAQNSLSLSPAPLTQTKERRDE